MNPKELGNEWMSHFIHLVKTYEELHALNRSKLANNANKESIDQEIAEKQKSINEVKAQIQGTLTEIDKLSEKEQQESLNCSYEGSGPYKGKTPLTAVFSTLPGALPENDVKTFIESLTSRGANINQLDAKGYGPIHYAINSAAHLMKYKNSQAEVNFGILMKHNGIDIHLKDRTGMPPIQQAMYSNEIRLIEPLVKLGAGNELFEPFEKKGKNKTSNPNAGNKFQDFYLYPVKGRARAYVQDPSLEKARRVKRDDNEDPSNLDALEKQFNRDNILALADKKLNEQGNPFRHYVYRGLEQEIKEQEVEELEQALSIKVEKGEMQEEEKQKILEEKKQGQSREDREKKFDNMSKFYDIIANPEEFFKLTPDQQSASLSSIFEDNHVPPSDKFYPLLQERKDFLEKIKEERSATREIADTIMMGHRLGFVGKFEYEVDGKKRNPIGYEGFSVCHTMLSINERISNLNELVQKEAPIPHNNTQFTAAEKNALKEVADTYKLMDQTFDNDNYREQATRYKNDKPILIPCHWPGHIANIVLYKDKLYVSNKGAGTSVPSVRCYQFDLDKLPRNERGDLDVAELAKFIETISTKDRKSVTFSGTLDLDELKALKPKLVYERRLQGQKQGNCTYTNSKRGVDAIMMALKDDAKDLQKKKDNGESLTEKQETILQYQDINNKKVFKAFTTYDRFTAINEYIEKHKDSPNSQKWDPLIRYLQTKASGNDDRSIKLSKHILEKLKSPPINKSEQQIADDMKNLNHLPTKLNNFGYFARHLEAGILKGDGNHLKKAFYFAIPGGMAYQRNKGLIAAGINPEILPRSNLQKFVDAVSTNPFRSKKSTEPKTESIAMTPQVPQTFNRTVPSGESYLGNHRKISEQSTPKNESIVKAVTFNKAARSGESYLGNHRKVAEQSTLKNEPIAKAVTFNTVIRSGEGYFGNHRKIAEQSALENKSVEEERKGKLKK